MASQVPHPISGRLKWDFRYRNMGLGITHGGCDSKGLSTLQFFLSRWKGAVGDCAFQSSHLLSQIMAVRARTRLLALVTMGTVAFSLNGEFARASSESTLESA